MKKIKAIHDFIRFLIKKHRSNHVTPEEIDNAINWGSLDKFNELYGLAYQFQTPVPVPRQGYEINQKNKDDLDVFLSDPTPLVNTAGVAPLPDDYVHVSFLRTTNGSVSKEVEFIRDDKWSFRTNRITAAPSYDNPVCRQYNGKLELLPIDIASLSLSYLKYPTKAVWAYTLNGNGRPVYDDASSIDFEWGEENHMDIITRALQFLGINLEDATAVQFKDMRKGGEA